MNYTKGTLLKELVWKSEVVWKITSTVKNKGKDKLTFSAQVISIDGKFKTKGWKSDITIFKTSKRFSVVRDDI